VLVETSRLGASNEHRKRQTYRSWYVHARLAVERAVSFDFGRLVTVLRGGLSCVTIVPPFRLTQPVLSTASSKNLHQWLPAGLHCCGCGMSVQVNNARIQLGCNEGPMLAAPIRSGVTGLGRLQALNTGCMSSTVHFAS
jgi:hypothetical protein